MWEWDRHVVLPLTFQAFDRAMNGQRDRYAELAEVTSEQAREWEEGEEQGRTLLESYLEWAPTVDRFWPVRVETICSASTTSSSPASFAWELFYLGMRIAGTIHNELRPGTEPPGPSTPVGRPRASDEPRTRLVPHAG